MVCAVTGNAATRALTSVLSLCLLAGALAAPAAAQRREPAAAVVRLPFPQYDGGLTPYTFELGYPLMTLVYDTLMWRDAEGVPQPWLADSVQRSRGGRRLTIRLRGDARWHDGRPVTADDVAFTFRLFATRRQPRFTPQLDAVEEVRAAGRLTATIDLRRPSLGFDDQPLSDVPILPRHLWSDLPAGRDVPAGLAIGSGPYRLTRASRERGYVLRANRDYFRGRPRVGELRVPIISDADEIFEALRERRVDMVPLSVPPGQRGVAGLGIAVRRGPWYSGTMLVLNTRRPPFDSAPARRAIADAMELSRIARNVARSEPADSGFLHPESQWATGRPVHVDDVAAARRAAAELQLPRIRVLTAESDPFRAEAGRQVVLALRRAGITANSVELTSSQLGRAIGEDGSAADFDAAITSIPPQVSYDPNYLRLLFGSEPRAAPLNFSGYRSDAFDAAARRVADAPTVAQRRRAIVDELQVLEREAPAIPLFFSEGAFAHRTVIYNGWTYIKGIGIFDKRSFLPGTVPMRRERTPVVATGDEGGGTALSVLNVLSLLVLGGVIVLAIYAVAQRRRT
jgi:peptide/nickel transport system substrate-binding protein